MTAPSYLQGRGFDVEIIRTLRTKTARLEVDDGTVSIIVPFALPQERIQKIVDEKTRWVKEKLYLHSQSMPLSNKEFISGEAFPYLGRNYRLKIEAGAFQPVKLKQGRLLVTLPLESTTPDLIRNALVRWYRHQAEQRFVEKVRRYAKIIGVKPASVGVKTFKSRWGSCSVKGEILFHWKVILAPHRIVDYVVVHELCHLKHHDHSPAFWKSVEAVIPDYLECKEWLKLMGAGLEV
ncbi:M48 family metallopeptidase [uncultured Deefgea sp.]|uniref:M48 family metallopeptidase n=1 Tax=uncultured Deefgea sp. TaxID=1304914 RepID=UPI002598A93C|nr:SprT family zinc-dependent metalloprotease [uncultured Deefgea sp.]